MRRIACPIFLGLLVVLALPGVAPGQSVWYARGDYNGWDLSNPMTDQGGGYYTTTITGLTTGTGYSYKIALEDWSLSAPGSDGEVAADASGEINYHFWENDTWADGWEPSAKMRVGYDDHQQFDWAVIGSFDGWVNDVLLLTDQGGGLHTGQIALAANTYNWKFRKPGDWAYSIGDDFGNAASDNSITVANDGDVWAFELDLPNGRWRAYYVPEPSTLALALLSLLGLAACVRRRM